MTHNDKSTEITVFAGGCFWCTEAVFNRVLGVVSVVSGYTGGNIKNPAYREICSGRTGHAEGVKITFKPEIVSFTTLLEIFFATHDPTTLNVQGNDRGTQYRSAIFYNNSQQEEEAKQMIALLEREKVFANPIVTEVSALGPFYEAGDDHDSYYEKNREQPYCQIMISPKIKKINTYFKKELKTDQFTR